MSAIAKRMREVLDTFVETMNAAGNPGAERRVQKASPRAGFLGQIQSTRRMPEATWNLRGTTITVSGALLEEQIWLSTRKPPPPDLFRTPYREAIIAHRSWIALQDICEAIEECLLENLVRWPADGPKLKGNTQESTYRDLDRPGLEIMLKVFFTAMRTADNPGAAPLHRRSPFGREQVPVRKPGWWIAHVGTERGGSGPIILTADGGVVTRSSAHGEVKEYPDDFAVEALANFRREMVNAETVFDAPLRLGLLRTLGRNEVPAPRDSTAVSPHLISGA